MSLIISRIMKHLKESSDLMTAEELIYHEFLHFMAETMGKVLTSIDRTLVLQKRMLGWKRVRADQRYLTFLFGSVAFTHTLMKTPEGVSVYPIHDFLGLHPYQKYTPAVELKVAESLDTACADEDVKRGAVALRCQQIGFDGTFGDGTGLTQFGQLIER